VETASNGEEGIQHFRAMGPDLVITDIRMPVKSGIELLKTVREESNDVEVIILTGHGDQSTAIEPCAAVHSIIFSSRWKMWKN
jgi:YesN/AraC family two-component response regulator